MGYKVGGTRESRRGGKKIKRKAKKKASVGDSHLSGQARKAEEALYKSSKKAQNI